MKSLGIVAKDRPWITSISLSRLGLCFYLICFIRQLSMLFGCTIQTNIHWRNEKSLHYVPASLEINLFPLVLVWRRGRPMLQTTSDPASETAEKAQMRPYAQPSGQTWVTRRWLVSDGIRCDFALELKPETLSLHTSGCGSPIKPSCLSGKFR